MRYPHVIILFPGDRKTEGQPEPSSNVNYGHVLHHLHYLLGTPL